MLMQGQPGGINHVVHLRAEHAADRLKQQTPLQRWLREIRVLGLRRSPVRVKQGNIAQLRQSDQAGPHAIINVVRVVGNLVGQIAQLGLQTWLLPAQEPPAYTTGLGHLQLLGMLARTMFEDALPRLKGEIEAVVLGVPFFEPIHHAQALQVVLKTPKPGHAAMQRILPRMPKRRMPQVMGQRNRLDQVLVDLQRPRNGPPELRHLQRVGQPGAEQIPLVVEEHLRLVDQAPERRGMHDPITVPLVLGARRRGLLRVTPPPCLRGV